MRRIPRRHRAQLVLAFPEPDPQPPRVGDEADGLLEALAELLLKAASSEAMVETGGADEHPDHA